jgi:hypothetical protein
VTTDGLPLGLAAVKFWNRKKFKGTAALKRKVNPTRVPFLDTHRTMCRTPEPGFRRVLEGIRELRFAA